MDLPIPARDATYLAFAVIYGMWEVVKVFIQKRLTPPTPCPTPETCLQKIRDEERSLLTASEQKSFFEHDMRAKGIDEQIGDVLQLVRRAHEMLIKIEVNHEKNHS